MPQKTSHLASQAAPIVPIEGNQEDRIVERNGKRKGDDLVADNFSVNDTLATSKEGLFPFIRLSFPKQEYVSPPPSEPKYRLDEDRSKPPPRKTADEEPATANTILSSLANEEVSVSTSTSQSL